MNKKYVYIKDSEGFVTKKISDQIQPNEIIISKEEFEKVSGIEHYNKNFGRGGARAGAGRKKVYTEKVKETFELEKELSNSLKEYSKEHKISKNKAINEAIKKFLKVS